MGLTLDDYPRPEMELWEENCAAMQLYIPNASQWRVGPAGPTGLDYLVFFHELDRMALPRDEYEDMMSCIRVVESAVLSIQSRS